MTANMIIVGMADLKVVKSPGSLTTLGLGSCVGIALYDAKEKIAGLAHIMLPDSKQIQNNSNVAKFADTAMAKLIKDMEKLGARRINMKAKIAGGAQMFAFNASNDNLRIGDRNIEACINLLKKNNIPLIAKETGENYGRTVELYADDGRFVIKSVGRGIKTV
ncbi:MAG: chemotaxis protein CheD [Defluviitaleaceae bacterium]|nr:chemotaxis protein CheD [Defluviitaleaceae bacterium]MCL2238664.1 chemotaxis protein CheD [Defluviitaleaceae bacterium]